jgi:nickel/cobalt transporter (NicO) family protein
MRRILTLLGLVLALVGLVFWALGGLSPLQAAVTEAQRAAQSSLAHAVRAIRAGEPGALAGLLVVTFGYGVLHAAGPGHGKLMIGGYAMARRVRPLPVILLALAASLAQAAVAVVLVYGAVMVLDWTRDAVLHASEQVMAPLGIALIGLLGLWLMVRGLRHLSRHATAPAVQAGAALPSGIPDLRGTPSHAVGHDPDHGHSADCGHAHGPTLEEIADVTTFRDAALLIAGVAIRPCTGALFLLILTWQLGIGAAGIAGTFAMGIGTAMVTIAAALLAIWAREGALAGLAQGRIGQALPVLELAVGLVIVVVAAGQLAPYL